MIFPRLFFPDDEQWRQVNLNYLAQFFDPQISGIGNPLINPDLCHQWICGLRKVYMCGNLWGGWMEPREFLWRGSYIQSPNDVHLGIDLWAEENALTYFTSVVAPRPGVVRQIWNHPEEFGWGYAIVIQDAGGWYVVAHLDDDKNYWEAGDKIAKGTVIGHMGSSKVNGGWAPHIHIQCSRVKFDQSCDGYGSWEETDKWVDPREYFRI